MLYGWALLLLSSWTAFVNLSNEPLWKALCVMPTVLRTPSEVVHPSADDLLAFELDGLGQVLHPCRDVQVKLVGQSVDLVPDRRVLQPPVGIAVRSCRRD